LVCADIVHRLVARGRIKLRAEGAGQTSNMGLPVKLLKKTGVIDMATVLRSLFFIFFQITLQIETRWT